MPDGCTLGSDLRSRRHRWRRLGQRRRACTRGTSQQSGASWRSTSVRLRGCAVTSRFHPLSGRKSSHRRHSAVRGGNNQGGAGGGERRRRAADRRRRSIPSPGSACEPARAPHRCCCGIRGRSATARLTRMSFKSWSRPCWGKPRLVRCRWRRKEPFASVVIHSPMMWTRSCSASRKVGAVGVITADGLPQQVGHDGARRHWCAMLPRMLPKPHFRVHHILLSIGTREGN